MRNYESLSQAERIRPEFGVGLCTDIPAFKGFFEFSKLVAGSSMLAAELVSQGSHDLVLNWMGGLHHAKRSKASGFCYVNDCVLGIMRLLLDHRKVLYIDIDVHHGDGVEEAFLNTDRVLTLSFHQFDKNVSFFPGTGSIDDVGVGPGKFHAINVPLKRGISDDQYLRVFTRVVDSVLDAFRPDAIFLQCGADSLVGDVIGGFNLTLQGHGKAVRYVLEKNLPTVCVGGGGYTVENVARCWAYESAIALDLELNDFLPSNLLYENNYSSNLLHYHPKLGQEPNLNDSNYLDSVVCKIQQHLKHVNTSVPFLSNANLKDLVAEASEDNKD